MNARKKKRQASSPSRDRADSPPKLACTACRQRKIRCSAERPNCAYCVSKDRSCSYPNSFKRAQCSQDYVDSLEDKVKRLEATLLAQTKTEPCIPLENRFEQQEGYPSRGNDTTSKPLDSSVPQHGHNDNLSTFYYPHPRLSSEALKYYGKSSTEHFALTLNASAQAEQTMSDKTPRNVRRPSASSDSSSDAEKQTMGERAGYGNEEADRRLNMLGDRPLLYRQHSRFLLDLYLEYVHPIWPIVIENESRILFDEMYLFNKPCDSTLVAQVYLMMALACQYLERGSTDVQVPAFDAIAIRRDFYLRAQTHIHANAFHEGSASMLQALLLIGIYQQDTMQFLEFYLTAGHAARMAQSLGFHISRPDSASIPPQQRELRRRLWWACFCLDRIASMLSGRPVSVPYGQFSDYQDLLPQPVDDQYIPLGHEQPSDKVSINLFFRHTIRLFHVMDDILLRLREAKSTAYHDSKNASSEVRIRRPVSSVNAALSLLNTILQLDGHLLSWHEYLPKCLRFSLDDNELDSKLPRWLRRQAGVLRNRFLGLRILLHRQTLLFLLQAPDRCSWPQAGIQEYPPIFSDCSNDTPVNKSTVFRDSGSRSSTETALACTSVQICVSSAMLQIGSIELGLCEDLPGEGWWSDFNFVFNALCVLCGAMALSPKDFATVASDPAEVRDHVSLGLRLIQHIVNAPDGIKVRKSEKFLRRLTRATLRNNEKPLEHTANDPLRDSEGSPAVEVYQFKKFHLPPSAESTVENEAFEHQQPLDDWKISMRGISDDSSSFDPFWGAQSTDDMETLLNDSFYMSSNLFESI